MWKRAILFDFDHTLVHSELDFRAMRQAVYAELDGVGWPAEGRDGVLMLELIEQAAATLPGERAKRFRERAEAAILAEEMRAAETAYIIPGTVEALARLHDAGRQTAVLTRNARPVLAAVLDRLPMACGPILARDDVADVKPHPDHARAAMRALDATADETLLVGDFTADIVCAEAAGIASVGVLTGTSTAEVLRAAGATAVLASVADLPDWLADQGW